MGELGQILAVLYGPLVNLLPKSFCFPIFFSWGIWWRLFQKRIVHTKFYINVFIEPYLHNGNQSCYVKCNLTESAEEVTSKIVIFQYDRVENKRPITQEKIEDLKKKMLICTSLYGVKIANKSHPIYNAWVAIKM